MPQLIEALAKEIAKSGTDVFLRYSPGRGIQWMTHERQTETAGHEKRR